MLRVCAITCLILSVSLPAAAQQEAGPTVSVVGVVSDASGGALPGATIQAVANGRAVAEATSGGNGSYAVRVPSRVPFTLEVRLAGFAEYAVDVPGSNAEISRNITLQIGSLSDTLIVTATRGTESRANVTASVTVATQADLHAIGATQLTDVLKFVPGLSVEGNGREGGLTSLFSRGGDSDYNVVLIDGVRANLDGGRFDFSRIAAAEIERVEIVRGSQSSLWGADAMGAVVQVFTKRAGAADAPELTGSLEGGTFNSWRGNTRLTGGLRRRMDYQAGVTYRKTDGAFGDILPEGDRYEQTAFDGAVGATLGSRVSVRSGLRYSKGDGAGVGPVTYGSRETGTVYDTEDFTWHANVSHAAGSRYTGTGQVNYFRYNSTSADNVIDPSYGTYTILAGTPNALYPDGTRLVRLIDQAEFNTLVAAGALPAPGQFLGSRTTNDSRFSSIGKFRRPAVKYQGDFVWKSGQRLSAGFDWERETNPLVTGFNLDNNGFFVQQQSTFAERIFLTVGARVDSKESYDTFFSPKLSAGGYLLPLRTGAVSSVKVFGNLGKGVKSATFTERFGGAGFADPNPDIKVERALSGDVGVEATFADQRIRGSLIFFDNHFKDQISYRPGIAGDGIPEYINIDGSKADGWEIEASLQRPVGGFTVLGTYGYVDTKVVTNQSTSQQFQPGQPLLRRPRHAGSFRAAWNGGPVTASFDVRVVGDRFDNSFLSLRTVPNAERPVPITTDITINPGYTVTGLGVDVRAAKQLTLYIRANNVTDTTYDSALGYPGLPRSIVAGAQFALGGGR